MVHATLLAGLLAIASAGQAAEQRAEEAKVHIVRISTFAFLPARLEIKAGDAVLWVNEDIAPHTATASDADWDTGSLGQDRSSTLDFAVAVAVAGRFAYHCRFHPQMRGEIVVVAGAGSSTPADATAPVSPSKGD